MLTGPDLADLIDYARTRGAKIILAGDLSQLQAVENGGGMSLLATRLGYARLANPVRFRHPWEQHASLRLRDGDTTVLADYDQHGRIHAGDPEQTMDAAAAAYVALSTSGTNTVLMAAGHALRRELNRRIRDDLIALGLVQARPAVTIADGAQASPGDLIICTRNDHTTEAGEPGRTLANGDLLRIEAITRDGLIVRRALDADPRPGQRRWTDRHFPFNFYQDAELGYAVTDHAAQGRTVHTGLAVITGTEDRQHAYVALTRGTDANHAYVFTASPKRADRSRPPPGTRTGPVRHDQCRTGRRSRPGHPARHRGHGARRARCCAGTGRPAALRHPGPPPGPGRRRPPGPAARHLDRRDQPGPRAALPGPARGRPAAPLSRQARAPGPVAVADPARRRTRRPRPRPGPRQRGRRTRPRRRPRHPGRPRRPHPEPDRLPGPAPARAVVRARPRHRRPRTPRLRHRDRRAHGRPQATPRRARRRMRAAVGGQRARPGAGASGRPAGLAAPGRRHRGVAGAIRLPQPNRPDRTRTRRGRPGPAGRLARGPGRPRPGRRPGRTRHAGTACCCTCATPTPSRPPGRPGTSRTSSARSATPPGTPA